MRKGKVQRDSMTQCQQKRQFMLDAKTDKRQWRWVVVDVSKALLMPQNGVRCMHCHGGVRMHKQRVPDGPQDHAEHLSRQDSENCRGGHYFKGTHHMSTQPVR